MVGDKIKYMRETSGYSQKELAKKVGIAQTTLSDYERGFSEPNYSMVETIAEACEFAIRLEDLNSGEIVDCDGGNRP